MACSTKCSSRTACAVRLLCQLPDLEACRLAQQVGLVGLLPGSVDVVAAEMTVGGRLAIDRAAQVQVADDRARPQVEILVDQVA